VLVEVLLKQAPLVVLLWEPTTVLVKVLLVMLSRGPAAVLGKGLSTPGVRGLVPLSRSSQLSTGTQAHLLMVVYRLPLAFLQILCS
jgi:ABC-type proline/glycine betaine transport system substrate-binding protein